MDLVIIILLIAAIIFMYKDIKFVTYLLGVLEIFFRIIHYLGDNISFININSFVNQYIPTSLFGVINKYTTGVVNELLCWLLVVLFIMFLIYLIQYLIRKK